MRSLQSGVITRLQRGQREGKDSFTYPYPLFALSLPSLCPHFALSEDRLETEQGRSWLKG